MTLQQREVLVNLFSSGPIDIISGLMVVREREREGGRERGREGGRERGREGGREGGRERGREGGRREGERREGGRECVHVYFLLF